MKRKNREPGDIAFFTDSLCDYLRENHPGYKDKDFVGQRGEAALDEFCAAVSEGANRLEATERANAVLYSGLRFSRYETIYNIIMEWFPEIPPSKRKSISMKILSESEDIFSLYDTVDEFEATVEYQSLQYELTGFIQQYIEDYGI